MKLHPSESLGTIVITLLTSLFLLNILNVFAAAVPKDLPLATDNNLQSIFEALPKKTFNPLNIKDPTIIGLQPLAQTVNTNGYVADELLVKYKKGKINLTAQSSEQSQQSFLGKNGLVKRFDIDNQNVSLIKITDGKDVKTKIAELMQDPSVEYAEPNYIMQETSFPNDPRFNEQWLLNNTGQTVNSISGTNDADIDAPEAWGGFLNHVNPVIVAVIDSGTAYNHPDLINNMWDGTNCVDFNGNALGNCIHGYDFISNDKDPYPAIPDSHGTHVAGIIGATANNGIGVTGINPNAKIMDLRASYQGIFYSSSVLSAISFAMHNGAKIINFSAGGGSYSQITYDAIQEFGVEAGGIFIAAAGNNSSNNDSTLYYPASYDLNNIISVASTDQNDNLSSFSDYGATTVDVGAPGSNILSTFTDSTKFENVFFENFNSVVVPAIPSGWSATGYAGTATIYIGGNPYNFGVGDQFNYPYHNNADYSLYSPAINLSNAATADLSFFAMCDTESVPNGMNDYMAVEISADNGASYQDGVDFDENAILNQGGTYLGGYAGLEFANLNISSAYLTSNFKLRFRWITNGSLNNYYGCYVTDIVVNQNQIVTPVNGFLTYGFQQGTSMAAPVVAGVASLVWGYEPSLTYTEVKNIILNSGESKASLAGKTVSGKRVNAYNALSAAQSEVEADAVAAINSATGGTMGAAITTYATTLGLDLTDYTALTNKAPVHTALVGQSFANKEAVKTAFDTAVSTEKAAEALSNFGPELWYRTGPGNWNVNQTKSLIRGDFNNDGSTDLAFIYDYGNNDMGIWVMLSNGTSFNSARLWYRTGMGNWNVNQTKGFISGDFNNDGYGDIGLVYDYGNNDMGIWVMLSNGTSFNSARLWYRTGVGNWNVNQTKDYISGDFNNDGYGDIGLVYDYGNNDMGIWVMLSNGSSINNSGLWYRTGAGNWNVNQTKDYISGDFNNDGYGDIGLVYDYGNNDMGIWIMPSNGSSITRPSLWYRSGINNWNANNTKFWSSGDFNNNQFTEITAVYDYGNYDMGILIFK